MTERQRKYINEFEYSRHLMRFRDVLRLLIDILKRHDIEISMKELQDICEEFKDICYVNSQKW